MRNRIFAYLLSLLLLVGVSTSFGWSDCAWDSYRDSLANLLAGDNTWTGEQTLEDAVLESPVDFNDGAGGTTGVLTINAGGDWSYNKDLTLSNGALAVSSTIAAEGSITGLVAVANPAAEYSMTTSTQLGGIVLMTTAEDVNLLVAAAGQSFKVIVRDVTETVSIRPYAGDTIVFPGITPVLDASDELDSPGAAQDELTCQCIVANIWYCNGSPGWTDGGAGD